MRYISSRLTYLHTYCVCSDLVYSAARYLRRACRLRRHFSHNFARVLRIRCCRAASAGSPARVDSVRSQCRVPARLQLCQPVAVHISTSRSAFRLQLAAREGCTVRRPRSARYDWQCYRGKW